MAAPNPSTTTHTSTAEFSAQSFARLADFARPASQNLQLAASFTTFSVQLGSFRFGNSLLMLVCALFKKEGTCVKCDIEVEVEIE
jgi:hypothetical protein